MTWSTLVIGTGYVGQRFLAQQSAETVIGLSRSSISSKQHVESYDLDAGGQLPLALPDHYGILYTVPPSPDSVTPSIAAGGKPLDSYVGKSGVASTNLRPSGKVEIESDVIDAVAEGEFISKGIGVRVTEISGNRAVVAITGSGSPEGEAGGGEDAGGKA